jgi:hypothetical protein
VSEDTARPLAQSRRAEATAFPGWIKPQLTKLVDQPPDGAQESDRSNPERAAPGGEPMVRRLAAGGNAIRTIGPSAMVTSSWRALPSVAISSEATRIFRRNIMFNLPTFSSSPTPDPSSAWYPLDRNDLQSSWYVLSEFDGLVKQFRDNRQACQLVQRSQEVAKSEHVRNLK